MRYYGYLANFNLVVKKIININMKYLYKKFTKFFSAFLVWIFKFMIRVTITFILVILAKSLYLCWIDSTWTLYYLYQHFFSLFSPLLAVGCITGNYISYWLNKIPFLNVSFKDLLDIIFFQKSSNSIIKPWSNHNFFNHNYLGFESEDSKIKVIIPSVNMASEISDNGGIGGNPVDLIKNIDKLIEEQKKIISDINKTRDSVQRTLESPEISLNKKYEAIMNLFHESCNTRIVMINSLILLEVLSPLTENICRTTGDEIEITLKEDHYKRLQSYISKTSGPNFTDGSYKEMISINNHYLNQKTKKLNYMWDLIIKDIKENHPEEFPSLNKEIFMVSQEEWLKNKNEIKRMKSEFSKLLEKNPFKKD